MLVQSFIWFLIGFSSVVEAAVELKIDGLEAEVSNSLVHIKFGKDALATSVSVQGKDIISKSEKSFYLDWTGTKAIKFHPSSIFVVEDHDARAHFYWTQKSSFDKTALNIELHYILEDGASGIYSYAKYTNDKNGNVTFAETRTIYRFDTSILTQAANQVRTGTLPTQAELDDKCETVQDATYLFVNGTYYSKYDYAVYLRETRYQGVFGNGYGAFVIDASREYHGGGSMKQDLTVHQNSLVANYFISAHFDSAPFKAPPGWTHIYGPFLIYFPTGDDGQIIESVKEQVTREQQKWPYTFVNDPQYPLVRGTVNGTVSGQKRATVTLYDSMDEDDLDRQQLGYVFTTQTDAEGNFKIDKVRPGSYKIVAYPLAGQGCENVATSTVTVSAQGDTSTVNLDLPEPENILWSIGEVNRRSDEFKYANESRNYKWEWEPPTTNVFTVGQSDPKNDWYYAQSQPGTWTIKYQDNKDGYPRTLRLPLAGAKKSDLEVKLNGETVGTFSLANDGSIYRSAMQSGWFRSIVVKVAPELVVDGENTIDLIVGTGGGVMYDAISLQVNK